MKIKENYKSILNILLEKINSGQFAHDSLLPTENELATKYGVSRPTITKVYDALQDEGYVIKRKGVGTRVIFEKTKSNLIFGLLLPGSGESEIFSIINNRFLEHSRDGKFNCLWEGITAGNAEMRKELIETHLNNYISRNVNGVFFAPLERISNAEEINKRVCDKFTNAGIPIILIDRDIVEFPYRSSYDLVSLDNFNAGYQMAEHLLDSNCTTIHFVYRQDSASSVLLRRLGAAAAMHKRGLNFSNENVYCGNPEDLEFVKQISIIRGKTGVMCANDSTAAMLISSFDTINVKISEDVLICGFDDMKYAKHLKFPLTSYNQPCEEITDVAIDLMMRRIQNIRIIPNHISLLGHIIPRDSTSFK